MYMLSTRADNATPGTRHVAASAQGGRRLRARASIQASKTQVTIPITFVYLLFFTFVKIKARSSTDRTWAWWWSLCELVTRSRRPVLSFLYERNRDTLISHAGIKGAIPESFRSKLFTSYILTIFKQRNLH